MIITKTPIINNKDKFIYILIDRENFPITTIRIDKELGFYRNSDFVYHPIIRSAIRFWDLDPVYISVSGDTPPSTSPGYLSALSVGLVNAIYKYKYSQTLDADTLSQHSVWLEKDLAKYPGYRGFHIQAALESREVK